MSSSKSDIGKNCKLNPMSELHRLVALNRVGGWLVVGGWGQFFTVPNLQKPQNLPHEPPPPHPPKLVWTGLFYCIIYQACLVTWLQYSPATVEVPGTNPTDASKLNFFLVTTKWGHVGKKRFPIFKSGLFRFLPPEGARRYDIISAYRSDRKLKLGSKWGRIEFPIH